MLPPLELGAIAVAAMTIPGLAAGTASWLAFLIAAAVLAAWAAVGVHAWRRAARRRARLDLAPGGSAVDLLWLAPIAIVAATGLWRAGGAVSPGAVLDRYTADWAAGRLAEATARFVDDGPTVTALGEAWDRQRAALANELVRLAPQAGDEPTFDPMRPIETVRWVDAGPAPGGGRRVALEVARRDSVPGDVFGLPVRSDRLVTLERLGVAELRPIPVAGVPLAGPWNARWRIVRLDVLGTVLEHR